MNKISFWAGVVVAAGVLIFAPAVHAAECRFDRTLNVSGNGALDVSTGSGELKVVAGDGSHVHISGHAQAKNGWFGGDQGDVQRICDNPPIQQAGNEVKVGAQENADWFRHISVDYTIEVPRGFAVNANSGSGDVELHDLGGPVAGNTGSGNLHASNLGAGAKLQTGSGNIVADGVNGDARLGTGSGDIQARFVNPGEVRATTGSGSIHLENVSGGLTAHTGSGTVEASGKPRSGWQIGSGSGSVKLHLPSGTAFTLDAQVSSGDIETSVPLTMQGSVNKHHVHGTVGGGGPEVRVQTGSGDIRID